jgi:hypothetical protein
MDVLEQEELQSRRDAKRRPSSNKRFDQKNSVQGSRKRHLETDEQRTEPSMEAGQTRRVDGVDSASVAVADTSKRRRTEVQQDAGIGVTPPKAGFVSQNPLPSGLVRAANAAKGTKARILVCSSVPTFASYASSPASSSNPENHTKAAIPPPPPPTESQFGSHRVASPPPLAANNKGKQKIAPRPVPVSSSREMPVRQAKWDTGSSASASASKPAIRESGNISRPSAPKPATRESSNIAPPSVPKPAIRESSDIAPPSAPKPAIPQSNNVAPPFASQEHAASESSPSSSSSAGKTFLFQLDDELRRQATRLAASSDPHSTTGVLSSRIKEDRTCMVVTPDPGEMKRLVIDVDLIFTQTLVLEEHSGIRKFKVPAAKANEPSQEEVCAVPVLAIQMPSKRYVVAMAFTTAKPEDVDYEWILKQARSLLGSDVLVPCGVIHEHIGEEESEMPMVTKAIRRVFGESVPIWHSQAYLARQWIDDAQLDNSEAKERLKELLERTMDAPTAIEYGRLLRQFEQACGYYGVGDVHVKKFTNAARRTACESWISDAVTYGLRVRKESASQSLLEHFFQQHGRFDANPVRMAESLGWLFQLCAYPDVATWIIKEDETRAAGGFGWNKEVWGRMRVFVNDSAQTHVRVHFNSFLPFFFFSLAATDHLLFPLKFEFTPR